MCDIGNRLHIISIYSGPDPAPHPDILWAWIWLHKTLSQSPCTALTAGKLPAVRAMQEDCQWLWKMVEIPTGHASPESIATEAIPTYM